MVVVMIDIPHSKFNSSLDKYIFADICQREVSPLKNKVLGKKCKLL